MSSYYVPFPVLPATFESLNYDTLTTILQFVGNKSYKSFGGLNKHCREIYLTTKGMTKETFLYGYGTLQSIVTDITNKIERSDSNIIEVSTRVGKGVVLYNRKDVLAWALQRRNRDVLQQICYVAAEEGRIDVLDEVWNNLDEDYKRDIFQFLDESAAPHGKVNVLKWVENKGLSIDNIDWCAILAAEKGHLHILQWLQDSKGLELDEELYREAANGGHLNVMKWLHEQEVDWDEWTFGNAASIEGNLEVLQWLHDEGCPWPEDDRVEEEDLKPEVVDWLRTNGYGDRINRRR